MDDDALRAGLAAGTDAAFRELRERYARSLFITCKRVLGNDTDAEDAMQDALIRAYEKRPQLVAAGDLKSYLVAMAHNIAVDRVRKQQRRNELDRERGGDADDAEVSDAATTADARTRAALAECIDALDAVTRELVLAHSVGENSWETMGALAKLTADAARMRFSRGLKALKACLGKKGVST